MTANLQNACPSSTAGTPILNSWCKSRRKRAFDIICGSALLLMSLPIMAVAAALIKLTSPGPVLFRHKRVGKDGSEFPLLKFRTMVDSHSVTGPGITRGGDPRVTSVGRLLRKWKIDELPQFINVVRGEISLVGPRPDMAKYLDCVTQDQRQVLSLKPGITSPATLIFRHEEELLCALREEELEHFYCSCVLPRKIQLELDYAKKANCATDIRVLFQTAELLLAPAVQSRLNQDAIPPIEQNNRD
jgi:lipopolysaccharide/colanic/teichoic acid biosynthesis glycosyltransferase